MSRFDAFFFKNNKGQGIAVQYVLTFFIVVGFVAAMSIYIRRVIQGRIHDARGFMVSTVNAVYEGNVYAEYEPYYLNTETQRAFDSTEIRRELNDYRYDVDQATTTQTTATQAPPKDAR